MRFRFSVLMSLAVSILLMGCAALETPMSSQATDWRAYGLEQGEKGWVKLTQQRLSELDNDQYFTPELYTAYSEGYEEGRSEYCKQSAFELGLSGNTYLGVCDHIDPKYYQKYVSGQTAAEWGYNANTHGRLY
ncbi:DUF2799 domain-containing protein [Vibrio astriarenae]|uniref:DUF2799 domain-containing protein n=1 Tax=Vibrio astriarenae TaxID=1481923 RepID=A0A7Z2YCJ7_9VIBR|nr:DUF2799 domain-containing protein [Vibrio astriarenae]QIA62356.1 DUF2799 domain-containing protein [Vibrio astriarenae]